MKVFISWSGDRSRTTAKALKEWLPRVIQAVKPWISSEDIAAGAGWNRALTSELDEANFGIICLNKENLSRPWVHFEAGALAKSLESCNVCPYLEGVEERELVSSPLSQFQSVKATKPGTLSLVRSINKALNKGGLSDKLLTETFNRWWRDLARELQLEVHSSPRPQKYGFEEIFVSRVGALREIAPALDQEREKKSKGRVWFVSTSLKGFFVLSLGRFGDGQEIMTRLVDSGVDLRILLTDPATAYIREWMEDAQERGHCPVLREGEFANEIRANVRKIKKCHVAKSSLRYYPAPAPMAAIATRDKMVLCPYTLQGKGHHTFALIVRRTREADIFAQCLKYNFEEPWKRAFEVPDRDWS